MTIVIRAIQAILVLAAVGAAVFVAVLALDTVDTANTQCDVQEHFGVRRSQQAECTGMGLFQAEATAEIAMAIAGLTAAIGAVALNGMVPSLAARPAAAYPQTGSPYPGAAAGYGTGTPPGGTPQPGSGYPPAGQYPQAGPGPRQYVPPPGTQPPAP